MQMTLNTLREINVKSNGVAIHLMTEEEAEQYAFQKYPKVDDSQKKTEAFENLKKNLEEVTPDNVYLSINSVFPEHEKNIGMMVVSRRKDQLVITAISIPNEIKCFRYRNKVLKQFIKYCQKTNLTNWIIIEDMNALSRYYMDVYKTNSIEI